MSGDMTTLNSMDLSPSAPSFSSSSSAPKFLRAYSDFMHSKKGHLLWSIAIVALIIIIVLIVLVQNKDHFRNGLNYIYTSGANIRQYSDRSDTGGETETMTAGPEDPSIGSGRSFVDPSDARAGFFKTRDRAPSYLTPTTPQASAGMPTREGLQVPIPGHWTRGRKENFDPLQATYEGALQANVY